MITLHVYLSAKPGKNDALVAAILDNWLPEMANQPGFINCALVKPLPKSELATMGAETPTTTYEAVSFWNSERERKDWVARPIHDEVFAPIIDAAASLSWTVQNVQRSWGVNSP